MQNTVLPNPKYPMFYIFDPGQKRLPPRSKTFITLVKKVFDLGRKIRRMGCFY